MSASTRSVQQPLGTRQMATALVAVGLAIAIAAAVGLSQLAATKTQTAPAAGAAPAFMDHGSRAEIGAPSRIAVTSPVVVDHSSRGDINSWVTAARPPVLLDRGSRFDPATQAKSFGGWNGPRLQSK